MKQIQNIAARLITLGRRIIPISALLCFVPVAAYSGEAETAQSVQGKAPCDWLQEVKRTNTWFERDQEGRRAASILQKEKRMGNPLPISRYPKLGAPLRQMTKCSKVSWTIWSPDAAGRPRQGMAIRPLNMPPSLCNMRTWRTKKGICH